MFVKDFDYDLPPELIANYPAPERDASRLMLLNRISRDVSEDHFKNITVHLEPGDLLVMNDTRVIPARLFGSKDSGGKVEIFLVRRAIELDHLLINGDLVNEGFGSTADRGRIAIQAEGAEVEFRSIRIGPLPPLAK